MQAIVTKWHGPTNTRGSRITARCDAGRLTVGWDYSLDVGANHAAAARALAVKLGWDGRWTGGSTPQKTSGYAFVCAAQGETFTVRKV